MGRVVALPEDALVGRVHFGAGRAAELAGKVVRVGQRHVDAIIVGAVRKKRNFKGQVVLKKRAATVLFVLVVRDRKRA